MMTKTSIALLVLTIAFFLGNMTAYSRTRMATHDPLKQDGSDRLMADRSVISPMDIPISLPGNSQAKEYEKLERTRKRSEIQEKIEASLIQGRATHLKNGIIV